MRRQLSGTLVSLSDRESRRNLLLALKGLKAQFNQIMGEMLKSFTKFKKIYFTFLVCHSVCHLVKGFTDLKVSASEEGE